MKRNYTIAGVIIIVLVSFSIFSSVNISTEFSTRTWGLPEAQLSQTVELKDGDTYDLTASFVKKNINGKEVRMLAYNGSVPGPTLKVPQGATVNVNFKNNTDTENTLHSHGLRGANVFDGVPDMTQRAIPVGKTFAYTLTFPDAGMYWYHPHMREDYAQELGLYGNFLVTPKGGSSWNTVDREVPLFVDDILMEKGEIVPFKKYGAEQTLMGRYGNIMFVNGETDYSLSVKKGEVVRFYITNSANARPFNLMIPGIKMKLVGGDNGLYERDEWKDSIVLAPSERAIVEVLFGATGEYALKNKTAATSTSLMKIDVSNEQMDTKSGQEFTVLREHPEVVRSINPLRAFFSKDPDRRISLSIDKTGALGMNEPAMPDEGAVMNEKMMAKIPEGGIELENTGEMSKKSSDTASTRWTITDEASQKKNMDIDWLFKKGDKVKIRITNDPTSMHPMQHPMHFHGQRFLVVNKNGVAQTNLVWKDTVLVPAGEYVDIILDASNKGTWMAHCHIAEHLEAGMMMKFKVE